MAEVGGLNQDDDRLVVAIGKRGSDSFVFGTELWAMTQITLLPAHKIRLEAREVETDRDRLSLLRNGEAKAALVDGRVPAFNRHEVRSVMALWPGGIVAERSSPARFLVRRDVDDETVYRLTKAMFEETDYMKTARDSLGIGSPSAAITGLDMPLHPGAIRYFRETGFGLEDEIVAVREEAADQEITEKRNEKEAPATATLASSSSPAAYEDFDHTDLETGEIEQIVGACRHALEVGSLSPLLGDLSHTGCEAYKDQLIGSPIKASASINEGSDDSRSGGDGAPSVQAVAAAPAISATASRPPSAPMFSEKSEIGTFEPSLGQGGPAIRWVPPGDEAIDETDAVIETDKRKQQGMPPKRVGFARQAVM